MTARFFRCQPWGGHKDSVGGGVNIFNFAREARRIFFTPLDDVCQIIGFNWV